MWLWITFFLFCIGTIGHWVEVWVVETYQKHASNNNRSIAIKLGHHMVCVGVWLLQSEFKTIEIVITCKHSSNFFFRWNSVKKNGRVLLRWCSIEEHRRVQEAKQVRNGYQKSAKVRWLLQKVCIPNIQILSSLSMWLFDIIWVSFCDLCFLCVFIVNRISMGKLSLIEMRKVEIEILMELHKLIFVMISFILIPQLNQLSNIPKKILTTLNIPTPPKKLKTSN